MSNMMSARQAGGFYNTGWPGILWQQQPYQPQTEAYVVWILVGLGVVGLLMWGGIGRRLDRAIQGVV